MCTLLKLKLLIEEATAKLEDGHRVAMFEDFEGEHHELDGMKIEGGLLHLKYSNEDGNFETQLNEENVTSLEIHTDHYGTYISGRDIDGETFAIQMFFL